MDDLAIVRGGRADTEIGFFRDTHVRLAQADALIQLATTVKDWKLLEDAVDAKIGELQALVDWWYDHVRRKGGQPKVADRATITYEEAKGQSGFRKDQISRWRKALADTDKYREQLILAAMRKAGIEAAENHRAVSTGEFEWYTPAKYVDLARSVMGGIDLDPASNPMAQGWIKAAKHFTQKDDGLKQEWHGRVWLNPPYAQPTIVHFIDKLVAERVAGRVDQAVLLTHNYSDTAWFHTAGHAADMICLTRGRIRFIDEHGDECPAPTQGQAFFYFGDHKEAFAAAFEAIGLLVVPWI